MRKRRFIESQEFATVIVDRWRSIINGGADSSIELCSQQMTDCGLKIKVSFDTLQLQIQMRLMSDRDTVLYTITTSDNTKDSISYAIDSILGYAKDVILCDLQEDVND